MTDWQTSPSTKVGNSNPDVHRLLAILLFAGLHRRITIDMADEVSALERGQDLARCPLLLAVVFETSTRAVMQPPYVPGIDQYLDLSPLVQEHHLDLLSIAKLALLHAFVETPALDWLLHHFDSKGILSTSQICRFLTDTESDYRSWLLRLQQLLYNRNQAQPLPPIDLVLRLSVQCSGHSFLQRIEGLVARIHNALSKSPANIGMIAFAIQRPAHVRNGRTPDSLREDVQGFLETLMASRQLIDQGDFQDSLSVLEQVVLKMHARYGRRHSAYHFLEYLWIAVQKLAQASLSSLQIADGLARAVEVYHNAALADRPIYHLPFVGRRWQPLTRPSLDRVGLVLESATATSAAVWRSLERCHQLAPWILALRDLLRLVLDAGGRSTSEIHAVTSGRPGGRVESPTRSCGRGPRLSRLNGHES
jgi:hypothetical protein